MAWQIYLTVTPCSQGGIERFSARYGDGCAAALVAVWQPTSRVGVCEGDQLRSAFAEGNDVSDLLGGEDRSAAVRKRRPVTVKLGLSDGLAVTLLD
jgi:hypothetical protein